MQYNHADKRSLFLYNQNMKRAEVIQKLNAYQSEIRQHGVKSLALFGSVARDEATPSSDVDILVEFVRPVGLFALIELESRLAEILGCDVNLGTLGSLNPCMRERVMGEMKAVLLT